MQAGASVPISDKVTVDGVDYLANIVTVAAGGEHSVAVSASGFVYAWGDNKSGEIGIGTYGTATVNVAQRVWAPGVTAPAADSDYLSGIVKVAAGWGFTLALDDKGGVYAWGGSRSGQLGNTAYAASVGTGIDEQYNITTPVRVVNGTAAGPNTAGDTYNYLSHVVDIDATQYTAVARRGHRAGFGGGF